MMWEQMSDLGQVLLNLARMVPGGMVVFVPSYNFLNQVMKTWKEKKLLESLNAKKKVRGAHQIPCNTLTDAG